MAQPVPAAVFNADPEYLRRIADYLKCLKTTAADAKKILEPQDWKQLCDAAALIFKK